MNGVHQQLNGVVLSLQMLIFQFDSSCNKHLTPGWGEVLVGVLSLGDNTVDMSMTANEGS